MHFLDNKWDRLHIVSIILSRVISSNIWRLTEPSILSLDSSLDALNRFIRRLLVAFAKYH